MYIEWDRKGTPHTTYPFTTFGSNRIENSPETSKMGKSNIIECLILCRLQIILFMQIADGYIF